MGRARPSDGPWKGTEEILVLLSGGVDSAACVQFYTEQERPCCALHVDYGQLAASQESRAAMAVANHFGIPLEVATWRGAHPPTEGEVAGRNAFLLSSALIEAHSAISAIALGVHAGMDYADCSPSFITNMQTTLDLYCKGKVTVAAPFLNWRKPEIWRYCREREVPLHLTWSCERGGEEPCLDCLSCRDFAGLHVHED